MKKVNFKEDWPESWKLSYSYELLESPGWAGRSGYSYAYANRFENILGFIRKYVRPGGSILDIAAAHGNYSLILAESGYSVTWNDIRSELADYVKLKYEYGNIDYKPGDVFVTDFCSLYDCIIIGEVIEHMAHPDILLKRASSFLKKDGFILLTTPNGGYFRFRSPRFTDYPDPSFFEDVQYKPDADGHIFLLHSDEIYRFAWISGLEVRKIHIINNSLTCGHVKLGTLLKIIPGPLVKLIEYSSEKLPFYVRKIIHSCFIVMLTKAK